MTLRCSNCGRFVSANYPCTNCGLSSKVPVAFRNKDSSRSSPGISFLQNFPTSSPIRCSPIPSFVSGNSFETREPNSSPISSQDLKMIQENLTSLKEQLMSVQLQITDLRAENKLLKKSKEELIFSQRHLKEEMEQKVRGVTEHLEDLINLERTEKREAMMLLKKQLEQFKELGDRCLVIEEKLCYEKAFRHKLEAEHLRKISDLENAKDSFTERYATFEAKLKCDEITSQEVHAALMKKLDDLQNNRCETFGRCAVLENELRQKKSSREEMVALTSELRGRMISLEGQQRNREIIIIILIALICWVLYSDFFTKF